MQAEAHSCNPRRTSHPTQVNQPRRSATLVAMPKSAKKKGRPGGREPGQWVHLTQDEVKSFRTTAGLSRGKLAVMLGVSSTSIQNWETGRSVPVETFQRKLRALIESGASKAPRSARRPSGSPSAETASAVTLPNVQVARLTVAGEVVKGFLTTSQGSKMSQEQLVALTRALYAALY